MRGEVESERERMQVVRERELDGQGVVDKNGEVYSVPRSSAITEHGPSFSDQMVNCATTKGEKKLQDNSIWRHDLVP
jgi:hypothetical protein